MGILRGFALVIVSVVLFVLLILAGVFGTLNYSLTYENVQPKIYTIADDIIQEQIGSQEIVNQLLPYLSIYCKNNTEIVQSFSGYTFVFPCKIVSGGYQSILNYSVNYLVSDFYYKDYNCTFVKCFEQSDVPLFLVSDFAKQYWAKLFYKSLFGIFILAALVLILAERKSNGLILLGSLSVIASLITLQLKNIGAWISKAILTPVSTAFSNENSKEIISDVVKVFFSESSKIFLWMFVIGIILIAAGIVFKLTDWGMRIRKKIEEFKTKDKIEELEEKTKKLEEKITGKSKDKKK